MGVLDLHADALTQAAIDSPYVPQPQQQKFSTWGILSAPARGAGAGAREAGAFGSDILGGFGQVAGQLPGGSQGMFGGMTEAEERQIGEQRQKMLTQGLDRSALGEQLRRRADEMRPDPQTAHIAETILFDASRVITKAIGYSVLSGVGPGAAATGFDEATVEFRRLRAEGVDEQTAMRAAGITGVATAAGVALPVAGSGLKSTAALYLAGGPGGYMAQQMLTRDVLQHAGYDQIAEQYDPLDPVGLAVSALIPLPFAAYGLRANRRAAALRSMPDLPPRDVPPADPAAPADVTPPSALTPTAAAVREYSPDEVAAARVALAQETRAAANPADAADMRAADQHEAALARAEEQIAAGERVDVAAVAPAAIGSEEPAGVPADSVRRSTETFGADNSIERQIYTDSRAPTDGLRVLQYPDGRRFVQTVDIAPELRGQGIGQALYRAALADGPLEIRPQFRSEDAARVYEALQRKGLARVVERDGKQYLERADPPIQTMATNLRTSMEALVRAVDGEQPRGAPPEPVAELRAPQPPEQAAAGRAAAPADTPGQSAESAAALARLDDLAARFPNLAVRMDDMAEAIPLREFLARAQSEADEMMVDAPLIQLAAECALRTGG